MTNRTLDRNDDVSHRPWPASPAKYPLKGRMTGPVYAPLVCCKGGPAASPYCGHAGDCKSCSVKLPSRPPLWIVRIFLRIAMWLDDAL